MAGIARLLTLVVLSLSASLAALGEAQAERRVALILGNSAYQYVPRLPNPTKDSAAIADLFRRAGFDVVENKSDLGITDLRRAMRDFSDQAKDADIAVVYYAGHGIEVDGTNYLIPIDAKLERDIDVEDETLSIDRILRVIEPARRLRLVILDACRDNPFSQTMVRSVRNRSIGRGLAKVEPTVSDTLIAFAAKAGSYANDGDGANSPFTTALLNHIATPGLDLRIAFGMVRDDVLKATGNNQEPFVYGSLGGSIVSLAPAPVQVATAPQRPTPANPAPPMQTASASTPQMLRTTSGGGFDDYIGHSVQIDFWEIEEETSPEAATHSSRRSWTVYFHARDDIQFRNTIFASDPSKIRSFLSANILGVPARGVIWQFNDNQITGLLRRPGYLAKASIKITDSECAATINFEKIPGKDDFEMLRNGTNEMMFVRAMNAEKVSCQIVPNDTISAPPVAAR